jgi:hypothetical protein
MAEDSKARHITAEDPLIESLSTITETGETSVPAEEADASRLRAALDTMDEKIKLLLARHAHLTERYVAAVEAQRDVEERLARMTKGGLDPRVIEQRAQELEARNERLSSHAAYLEGRIESLLARVRYVLE